MKKPYLFDEFFASGMEETVSPFLTPNSKNLGKHLSLKSSLIAAFFLSLAYIFPPVSPLFLALVFFLVGTPSFIAALTDIKNLEINIDVLMTLAAFAALFLGSGLEGGLLLVLFELSHGLEDSVTKKAKSAIHDLHYLSPKFAYVESSDGTLFQKAVREIGVGETLLVKTGEIIPLDGIVLKGSSLVNLVHITGESTPIPKSPNDTVVAGSKNLEAALTIQVTRISSDSTLAKIIKLITEAGVAKPKIQRTLDQFGKHYATAIIGLTLFFAIFLPLFLSQIPYLGNEGAIYRSLAFLIAASPCALIIATPTAYLSAISACAKKGILLKGGVTLDALASCKAVAFDKTGTLTKGELVCTSIEPCGNTTLTKEEALSIAYGLERQIVHPIGTAVCAFAVSQKVAPKTIDDFCSIPGFGLEGKVDTHSVFIGLPERVLTKISTEKKREIQNLLEKSGKAVLALLLVDQDVFLFRFSDVLRDKIGSLIEEIKKNHLLIPIMLTGDHKENALHIGKLVGIDEIYYELRPEDKLAKIGELSQNHPLAMIGDGVNDAPALARATVGISMGKIGSRAAIDASDVVLLSDDLLSLGWLFGKAKSTTRIVTQNLTLALFLICAASIPSLFGLLPLWAAVILHEGGTLLVGLNSLRLYKS